jgi:hypothetical protein
MNPETTKTKLNKLADVLQDDLIVLLCAPTHDRLTNYTSDLLENLPTLKRPTNVRKFTEPLTYESLLQELAIEPETDVAVVFWGHGDAFSLLGPPVDPKSKEKSRFYDATFINSGPKYMLAFCCSAAVGLSRLFDARTDRVFIGFDREIGFILRGSVYAEWWKKVVHSCAEAMLNCKDVEDLRTTVQDVYKSALSAFQPGAKPHRYGLLMRAYLRGQLEGIDFVRT